jgi:hypothetical protein
MWIEFNVYNLRKESVICLCGQREKTGLCTGIMECNKLDKIEDRQVAKL